MSRFDENRNFINNFIFSDEAFFVINGSVNHHNCRFWADENHTQYPEKVNVWTSIVEGQLIGLLFIEEKEHDSNLIPPLILISQIGLAIQLVVNHNHNVWFLILVRTCGSF